MSYKAIEGVIREEIKEIIVGRHSKSKGLLSNEELVPEQLEHAVNEAYCHLIGLLPLLALGDMDSVILSETLGGDK